MKHVGVSKSGSEPRADEWFDELPDVLSSLTERWQVEFGSPIPRGSMSVVIRAGGLVEVRRC
jgi:hypothetical protein